MDVSEIGFRERYQSALTNRIGVIPSQGSSQNIGHVIRKSAIIPQARNDRLDARQIKQKTAEVALKNGGIRNDYYMLAAE